MFTKNLTNHLNNPGTRYAKLHAGILLEFVSHCKVCNCLKDHEVVLFKDTRASSKQHWKLLYMSLNCLKHMPKIVPNGNVLLPLELKTSKLWEEKRKKSNDKGKFNKINHILLQHYHAFNAIDSSMQVLIYLVIITIKEGTSKKEIKFLDTRDKATTDNKNLHR